MKTCIDVSHIINWRGNLTGIERVEFNLINNYYNNTNAFYICWDGNKKCFRELSRDTVKKIILDRTSEEETLTNANSRLRKVLTKIGIVQKSEDIFLERSAEIKGATVIVLVGLWDNSPYIEGLVELSKDNSLVHIVYDMLPIVQKGFFVEYLPDLFEKYMLSTLPRCKAIMAISRATASDVEKVLISNKVNVPPIATFRLGDEIIRAEKSVKPDDIGETDFLLCVGTVEARKNHFLLYYAYKKLLATGYLPPKLIIVGRRGWLSSDFQYIVEHDEEVNHRIVILDNITDSQIRWLYENCSFTIFPSLYEGWGLPISESLQYGKVTLCSNSSSMPEVGGKSADYFSPFSPDELSSLIMKYQDKVVRSKREIRINKGFQSFSWAESFASFVEALDTVITKTS